MIGPLEFLLVARRFHARAGHGEPVRASSDERLLAGIDFGGVYSPMGRYGELCIATQRCRPGRRLRRPQADIHAFTPVCNSPEPALL